MLSQTELYNASQNISRGEVVIIPTDTIFGFSCDPYNGKAAEKIDELKQRDNKPYIILDSDPERIYSYFFPDRFIKEFIDKLITLNLWPGNITLIARKNAELGFSFLKDLENVAVRYTSFYVISQITGFLGKGIVSTSVNVSGEKPMNDPEEIEKFWRDKVSVILKGQTGGEKPSAIISLDPVMRGFSFVRMSDELTADVLRKNFNEIV